MTLHVTHVQTYPNSLTWKCSPYIFEEASFYVCCLGYEHRWALFWVNGLKLALTVSKVAQSVGLCWVIDRLSLAWQGCCMNRESWLPMARYLEIHMAVYVHHCNGVDVWRRRFFGLQRTRGKFISIFCSVNGIFKLVTCSESKAF